MRLNLLYDNNETKTTTTTTTTLQSMWRFFIDGQTHRTQQKSLAKKDASVAIPGCWHGIDAAARRKIQDARCATQDAGFVLYPITHNSSSLSKPPLPCHQLLPPRCHWPSCGVFGGLLSCPWPSCCS